MPPVTSSAILAIDYDPATLWLEVLFVTGRRYGYEGVPAEVYAAFLAAASKGEFFNACIRDQYSFARIGTDADE